MGMPRPVLALGAALSACAVLLAVAWAASTGLGSLASGERPVHFAPATSSPTVPTSTPPAVPPQQPLTGQDHSGPDLTWIGRTIAVIFLLAAVALASWMLWVGLSNRRTWQRTPRQKRIDFDRPSDVSKLGEDLASAREEHLRRLAEGTPRNGIVQCWMAFEDAARAVHLPPRLAETPTEFLTRLLEHLQIDPGPGVRLAGLYHVARFSSHPISETDREAARKALLELHAQLGTWRGRDAAGVES